VDEQFGAGILRDAAAHGYMTACPVEKSGQNTREHLVDLPEIANWHWTDDFADPIAPPPLARTGVQTFTNA
jgi:hypothetical protein